MKGILAAEGPTRPKPLTYYANDLVFEFVDFEWDDAKDRSNQQKHGVSFEEARRLFESGVEYLEIFDAEHSDVEDRFIAIGPIDRGLVVVVYTERDEHLIRIIGARLANKREQSLYHSHVRTRK